VLEAVEDCEKEDIAEREAEERKRQDDYRDRQYDIVLKALQEVERDE